MKFKNSVWAISITTVICVLLFAIVACAPTAENSTDTSFEENASSTNREVSSEESSISDVVEFEISVEYVSADEADIVPDFTDKQQSIEFIKILVNKTVKNFNFISFSYDENSNLRITESLFSLDELSSAKPFYAKTHIAEGASNRGISFENEDGETFYYRIMYNSVGSDSSNDSLYLETFQENIEAKSIDSDMITLYVPDPSDGFNSFKKLLIDPSVTAENIVHHCVEEGLFPGVAKIQNFEIKDGIGYLDMNADCYSFSDTYHETVGKTAVRMTFLENFKDKITDLIITYDGNHISSDPFVGV